MNALNSRNIVSLASLAVALLFERFAYYGVRSILVLMMLKEFHFEKARAMELYSGFTTAVYVCCVIAAVIAAVIGPRISLMVGMGVTVFGIALLVPVNPSLLLPALGLIAFGSSLARVSLFAMAGGILRRGSEALAIGVVTLFYGAVNIGAFLTPLVVGTVGQSQGFGAGMAVAAGAAVLASGAAIAAVSVSGLSGDRELGRPLGLVGALLIVAVMVPIYVLMEAVGSRQYSLVVSESSAPNFWFLSLNPVVVIVSGIVTATVLIVLGARRSPVRAGWIFGAGAVLFALAAIPTLLATEGEPGLMAKLVASASLGAVGEQVLSSAAIAMIITCASPRLASFPVAAFFVGSFFSNGMVSIAEKAELQAPLTWAAFAATLVVGVAVLALGGVLHRVFFVHGRAEPEAPAPVQRPAA